MKFPKLSLFCPRQDFILKCLLLMVLLRRSSSDEETRVWNNHESLTGLKLWTDVFFLLLLSFPHSFSHFLSHPIRNVGPQKKTMLVTGYKTDTWEWEKFFRKDMVEILKALQDNVLETTVGHGITFEDGCMLLEFYKDFYIFFKTTLLKWM